MLIFRFIILYEVSFLILSVYCIPPLSEMLHFRNTPPISQSSLIGQLTHA